MFLLVPKLIIFCFLQSGECVHKAGSGCFHAESRSILCSCSGLPHWWLPGHPLWDLWPASDFWWGWGIHLFILSLLHYGFVSSCFNIPYGEGINFSASFTLEFFQCINKSGVQIVCAFLDWAVQMFKDVLQYIILNMIYLCMLCCDLISTNTSDWLYTVIY